MKLRHRLLALVLTVPLTVSVHGCAADPHAQWKGLGAVYASQVPIYPGARFDDAMGGDYYGNSMDHVAETMSWYFNVADGPEKVVAYYERKFPNAEKKIGEDGEVVLKFVPNGAEPGEIMWLRVRKGRLSIGEETKPGKHKDT